MVNDTIKGVESGMGVKYTITASQSSPTPGSVSLHGFLDAVICEKDDEGKL